MRDTVLDWSGYTVADRGDGAAQAMVPSASGIGRNGVDDGGRICETGDLAHYPVEPAPDPARTVEEPSVLPIQPAHVSGRDRNRCSVGAGSTGPSWPQTITAPWICYVITFHMIAGNSQMLRGNYLSVSLTNAVPD